MKKKNKWPVHLAAGCLVVLALGGVALAAGQQGTQSDPLVTLSYLNEKATPAILAQVDTKLTQREAELKSQLAGVVSGYVKEVEDKLGGGGGTGSASYTVVTLTQGQRLDAGVGCELLLRGGTGTCISDSAPGLVDMTDGGTLASGGALALNHLYLSTAAGRGVLAQNTVTLLVRGSYTVG